MKALLILVAALLSDPGDRVLPDGGEYTPACACSNPSAGPCLVASPDGGSTQAPRGVTLAPGSAGSGCVPKDCAEPAGEVGSSWPAECPP